MLAQRAGFTARSSGSGSLWTDRSALDLRGNCRQVLPIFAVLLAVGAAHAGDSPSGTWRRWKGTKVESVLRTIDRGGEVEFQLELWNGPPAYNLSWTPVSLQVNRLWSRRVLPEPLVDDVPVVDEFQLKNLWVPL
mgnify:FL=1